MRAVRVFVAIAVLIGWCLSSATAAVTLVENGEPRAVIVIAENPSRNAKEAAAELQHYIEKMSGAKLEIISDAAAAVAAFRQPLSFILVGRSGETRPTLDPDIPSGLTKGFREEGYVIRTEDNRLLLAGNDAGFYLGTRYAVCELLNRLGVRWFMPGEFGEVVPKLNTIVVEDLNVLEKPDFAIRDYWTHAKADTAMFAEREEWKIHNKMTPGDRGWTEWLGLPGDGSVVGYLPKDQFEAHPDWFALQRDGKRYVEMPCMTSPGMTEYFINTIKARAAKGEKVSSFAPVDGNPRCYCENCQRIATGFDGYGANTRDPLPEASISNEWFTFVDAILKGVNKEYPEYLIATNGYANRDIPPELPGFNAAQNLVVMFANIGACTIHSYDDPGCWQMQRQGQMLKRWCELSDKVWIYNYNYTMLVAKDTLTPMVTRVRHNMPRWKEWGLFGFFDQDEADMSMTGITTHYVRAKLEWDTKADVDALLNDYFEKWFGPAAQPMRAYYDALEAAFATAKIHGHEDVILVDIYTPELMQKLGQQIQQAERLAAAEPQKSRLRLERLMYDHLVDYVAMENAKQQCSYDQAVKLLDHMIALRQQMHQISIFFGWRPYPVYDAAWEKKRLETILAKVTPPNGAYFAVLPTQAKFRIDPYDDGVHERWQDPKFDDSKWRPLSTTRGWESQGFQDAQGHAYKGVGWYRLNFAPIVDRPDYSRFGPPDVIPRRVRLYCPAVSNEAWVWVNGRYVGHKAYQMPWFRPSDFDFDTTDAVKHGQENQVTIRVLSTIDTFGASGIYERMFVYEAAEKPKGEAQP